jgi:hypothetical protein
MTTNYTLFQSQFLNAVAAVSSDVTWATELPLVIDRAEQRSYRDLDMLAVRTTLGFTTLGGLALQRLQTIPVSSISGAGLFIAVEQINIFTPVTTPSSGTRNPLTRASPQFIDLCWPSDAPITTPSIPQYWAMVSDSTFLLGPPPDQAYGWEIRGPIRPAPLSASNSSTPLTQNYPDLFWAAAMIEAGMYMRYIEPAMGATWLAEYNTLKTSALTEEMRKRSMAEGWVDKQPSPIATPPRQ